VRRTRPCDGLDAITVKWPGEPTRAGCRTVRVQSRLRARALALREQAARLRYLRLARNVTAPAEFGSEAIACRRHLRLEQRTEVIRDKGATESRWIGGLVPPRVVETPPALAA
jgi:hypothetical protein